MFRETVNHGNSTTEGTASEQHALLLLRRAARREYRVEATAAGGAVITWTRHLFGLRDGDATRAERSITLTPRTSISVITERTRDDLLIIDGESRVWLDGSEDRPVVLTGLCRIPPAATARLRARHLITVDPGGRVRLTLVARLALLAQEHRTRTTEPVGWTRPAGARPWSAGLNKPGRRNGLLYSRASAAVCACGFTAHCGDREEARREARAHREEAAAVFLAQLAGSPAE